jgi:hypothetical protein
LLNTCGSTKARLGPRPGDALDLLPRRRLIVGFAACLGPRDSFLYRHPYSLARFLRFWLLRQLYDGQAHIDQVVSALAGPAPSPVDNSAFHAERCSDHIATTPE